MLREAMDHAGDSTVARDFRIRLERLEGVLAWRLETEYHERLTTAHTHLRDLNQHIETLQARYDSFVRTRQAASHSYVGYEGQIDRLERQVTVAIEHIEGLEERQGKMLEAVSRRELMKRRERLEGYQNKARFAFADSYDRAAKSRTRVEP
jgi:chromosome segregation ATPase